MKKYLKVETIPEKIKKLNSNLEYTVMAVYK